ncbi:MAG TPA: SPFH domain-containing protein, partial [Solirubrobacteraceae bacterium]|nr:SPFH domain-containing protein [Solirubrobacteraceae bacterium]
KTPLQPIISTGRGQVQRQTTDLMQRTLDSWGAGITVVEVQIRSANPPQEVVAAFREVANAGQDAESAVNEANTYRNRVINEAKGDAARIVQSAQGYREQAVREALALLPPDGRADLVVLAACVAGMDTRALLAWLDDLGFRAGERDLVAAASRFATGAPLRAARTPAQIASAARGAPVEAVALAGGENARRWLQELRHVRLEITGDDLIAAGVPAGPEVGERLRRALDRKLDDGVAGREAELRAALADER